MIVGRRTREGILNRCRFTANKFEAKSDMRGIECMMVGNATNHAGDVYKMYDPIVNTVYKTRDVKWHARMCFHDRERKQVQLPSDVYPITTVEEKAAKQ